MSRGYDRIRTHQFENTRIIAYQFAVANWDPKKPIPTMEQYWPLSTDESEIQKHTEDLYDVQARAIARLKELFPHKYKA